MSALDLTGGVMYPQGGFTHLIGRIADLATAQGVRIHLGASVTDPTAADSSVAGAYVAWYGWYERNRIGEEDPLGRTTGYTYDTEVTKSEEGALIELFKKQRPGEPPSVEAGRALLPRAYQILNVLDDTRRAVELGADEIDMVIDRGAFLAGRYAQVFEEIR